MAKVNKHTLMPLMCCDLAFKKVSKNQSAIDQIYAIEMDVGDVISKHETLGHYLQLIVFLARCI